MQKDQDIPYLIAQIEKDNYSIKEESHYNLPFLSLITISKSLIWLGIVMDSAVCFVEFMVVWLKVQAPGVFFYCLSAARYLIYIGTSLVTTIYWYDLILETWEIITLNLATWTLCRILYACCMICMNKDLSNEVDGINNPVAHAVGSTGKKAIAGA